MEIEKKIENSNFLNCRICYEKEEKKNIFGKNICDCSEKYPVHINCLLIWLKKKCCKKLKNKQITFYDFSTLKCDICLKYYPESIIYEKKKKKIKKD